MRIDALVERLNRALFVQRRQRARANAGFVRWLFAVTGFGWLLLSAAGAMAQAPVCSSITQTPANPVNAGTAVTLTANCTTDPNKPTMYQWFDPSANPLAPIGSAPSITLTSPTTGLYQVRASNSDGLVTVALIVQVGGPPVFVSAPVCTVTQNPANPVSPGTTVTLTAKCSDDPNNPTSYLWGGPTGIIGNTSSVTVTAPTAVSFVASNGAGLTSFGFYVGVLGPGQPSTPVCSITQNPANPVSPGTTVTLTANCSNTPTAFAWSTGGASVGNAASITVKPSATTTYTLSASNAGGSSAPITDTVQIGSGAGFSSPVVTAPSIGLPGSSLQLTAKILDGSKNPVGAGVSVTWDSSDPGDSFVPQATVLTDNTSSVSTTLKLSASAADRHVRACITGTTTCTDTVIKSAQAAVQKPALQLVGPQATVAAISSRAQLDNIRGRLDQLRASRTPGVVQGLSANYDGKPLPPMSAFAFSPLDMDGKFKTQTGGGASADPDTFERVGTYITGVVDVGKQSTTASQAGFDLHSNGITIGADYRFSGNHVVGAGLGILKATTDLDESAGTQDAKGYSFSLYGSYVPVDNAYVDLIANLGRNTYDSARHATDAVQGTVSEYASSTHGNQYAISLSAGCNISRGPLTLNPYARAEFIDATVNSFSESSSAASTGAIQVSDQHLKNTLLAVAGQASYALSMSWGVLLPNVRVEFQRQTQASAQGVTAQLVADVTSITNLPGAPVDKNFGNYALGFSAVLPHRVSGFFTYERSFGKDAFREMKYTLGLRVDL